MKGFLMRARAMTVKEFLQLRRDRVTFAMMIVIPLLQLLLFGYAINTNPRHLPTVVLLQEESDVARALLAALDNTGYLDFVARVASEAEFDAALASGEALIGIEIPAGFARDLRRGLRPALLVAADATDPVATGSALTAVAGAGETAFRHLRGLPPSGPGALFEVRSHARYNPAAVTQLNVVPGLLGTILTMTLLIFTALSVTRERERGTMEALLAMPIRPLEIMIGKILPYIGIGFLQATIIVTAGTLVFGVPVMGSLGLLAALSTLFIAANLAIGYSFSTVAKNQLQAVQMAFMFFLPNILLSGFMFPFAGMPGWAQWIGEALPLTHYIRIVRGIMLKGSDLTHLQTDVLALAAAMVLVMIVAVTRFRQTLD
jgi:ABC-2 type transport system permease protein